MRRLTLSGNKVLWLVRSVAIGSFFIAVFFIVWTGNWVTAAKSVKTLPGRGLVQDLWFSSDRELFVLEEAGEDQLLLRKWEIGESKATDARIISLKGMPKVGINVQAGNAFGSPLLAVSRDGMKLAWIASGFLCEAPSENFNGSLCEVSIGLPDWQRAKGLSFFGSSPSLVGVIFDDGRFRVFDFSRGENKNRPGSEFLGPWILRNQGETVTALPEKHSGNLACIEMLKGRIHPFTPDLSPLVVSAISSIDCDHIVIGTSDGLILPLASKEVSDVPDNTIYGTMSGAIHALALSSTKEVFVAGEFDGIYQLSRGGMPRKILEVDTHVRFIEVRGSHLVYLSSVPTLVALGREWQPSSASLFIVNLVVVIASLCTFLYTIFSEKLSSPVGRT